MRQFAGQSVMPRLERNKNNCGVRSKSEPKKISHRSEYAKVGPNTGEAGVDAPAPALLFRWTFGAGVPDRVENFGDRCGRRLRRDAGRRIVARHVEGALAGVRISAVLLPAVLLALADGARFVQH